MDSRTIDLMFATGSNDQATPQSLFDEWDARFRFAIDVAATAENRKCDDYFGPDHDDPARRDCLEIDWPRADWTKGACWMNPPYGEGEEACKPNCKKQRCHFTGDEKTDAKRRGHCIDVYQPGCIDFVRKASKEARRGSVVVCLLAGRTDTNWYHRYIYDAAARRYRDGVEVIPLKGRLKFNGATNSAPFPSIIVIFRPTY